MSLPGPLPSLTRGARAGELPLRIITSDRRPHTIEASDCMAKMPAPIHAMATSEKCNDLTRKIGSQVSSR